MAPNPANGCTKSAYIPSLIYKPLGVVEAYCLVKAQHDQASLNLLYALHGAVHNVLWNQLTPETKAQLQTEVTAFHFGAE